VADVCAGKAASKCNCEGPAVIGGGDLKLAGELRVVFKLACTWAALRFDNAPSVAVVTVLFGSEEVNWNDVVVEKTCAKRDCKRPPLGPST